MSGTFRFANRNIAPALIPASVALLMLILFAAAPARALADDKDVDKDWKILGDAKVDKRGEADEIKVGSDEGVFKQIKFEVRGADVEFKKVTVVYSNDESEEVQVRDKIKRGEQSRPIDLKGRNRSIKKVLLAYKTVSDGEANARVVLLGT